MKKIIDAPYIDQSEKWPTGCESVTAVMALKYIGADITVDEFIGGCLVTDGFETRDGALYGPDPDQAFVGSPYDRDSFGCYSPVIKSALEKAAGAGIAVDDLDGEPMESLIRNYIDNDIPVIFWSTIDMLESYDGSSWRLKNDESRIFTWRCNEHCLLLVGYDDDMYYFNDPWANHGLIGYEKDLAEKRHADMRSMALAVRKTGMQANA